LDALRHRHRHLLFQFGLDLPAVAVIEPAATKKRNSDSPCATYPPCTGLALSGLHSERLKLTPLTGDAALDDEDVNQRSSEIRLLPKPRLAHKDIMFEPEQPVCPRRRQ
jgi:hypothetical protein